jgi:hydrogenase expression/formation protein HypC
MCLGIPGKVLEVVEAADDNAMRMGKVEFGGISKDICLAYLPEVEVGDYVLVHVGFAISKIDEQEATEIFSYIEQIGELSEMTDPFDAMQTPSSEGKQDDPAGSGA